MIKAMPGIIESWRTIGISYYEVVKEGLKMHLYLRDTQGVYALGSGAGEHR